VRKTTQETPTIMKMIYYSGFILVLILAACGARTAGELASPGQAIDEIIWEDWGPVVAPQYNRTFKVTLSRVKQTLTIDSLRTAGVEVTHKLPTAEFDRILALKISYKIAFDAALAFDGCVGGSGQTLTFLHKGVKIAEGEVVDCGRAQRSNITGNLDGFTQAIRDLAFGK
jgi:hypothetical protein